MSLEGFQKRLLIIQSDIQTDAAFMAHGDDPPNFVPIAPVETLKQAYSDERKDLWIAVANWASPMFNRVDTFAAYLQMFENANADAKLSTYFSKLSQTPDIKTDITVARAISENDDSPLFSAAKVNASSKVYLKEAFERMKDVAAGIRSPTLREEKNQSDDQGTVLFRGDSTPSDLVENKASLKRPLPPVPEDLPDADEADLPSLPQDSGAPIDVLQMANEFEAKWERFKAEKGPQQPPSLQGAFMLLSRLLVSIDPTLVPEGDKERMRELVIKTATMMDTQLPLLVVQARDLLSEVVNRILQTAAPQEVFINYEFLEFVTQQKRFINPQTEEEYAQALKRIPDVFVYVDMALADVAFDPAEERKSRPSAALSSERIAEIKNAQGQEMTDSSRRTSIARSMLRQGAPGGDPNPGNGTSIAEGLDSGPSTTRSGRGVPFSVPSAPGGVAMGVPRKRAAYDHTIVRVPMFRPMQPYYLIDMGYMDTTSGQFNGKSLKEIAIRQGDLIFRYKDKNSTPAVTVNWNRASFWGIAAAAKASFFAGDKVTFPVALGGGMSTINRAPSAVAPFDVLTPNANRYTDEWMDNSKRRVGSLEHTFKDDPCIVSLNWAQPGHQLDVIVYY